MSGVVSSYKIPQQEWTPADLRELAIEDHYERQHRVFRIPLYIGKPEPTGESHFLEFRTYWNPSGGGKLENLTPEHCRLFCWKDCAIHGSLDTRYQPSELHTLFNAVYREWFPHRARDKDMSDGSFFAKYMCFIPEAASISEVIRFYDALWTKLCALETVIPERLPPEPGWALLPPDYVGPIVEFKLRATFEYVFIILVDGWQDDGVLAVFKSAVEALKHRCERDTSITRYYGTDYGDFGEASVFSCSLRRAMQLVVSTDPDRSGRRSEYNEMLDEVLGESDDEHS
nr:hypothetical protein CFP56_07479 [Quercus suber]